ncbi:MAG: 50S ribosomal protein L25 [Patescibacteria group bacterium]|jgi:large subunit ribosomal protein L25
MITTLQAQLRQKKEAGTQEKPEVTLKAVVYGHGLPSRSIKVATSEFLKVFRTVKHSTLLDLTIEGEQPVKALVGEVQVNPVTMAPVHVDFRQLRMDELITISVPLVYTGDALAVKALGGTLIRSLDELEVECLPADLPKEIVVDMTSLATFEDKITVGSLVLPKGVKTTVEANVTLASVEAPLSEDEQKKLEQGEVGDVTAVKTEAEEKKEKEATEEAAAAEAIKE